MANLSEQSVFHPGIFQLELNTPVIGGVPTFDLSGNPTGGWDNAATKQLADRTRWLFDRNREKGAAGMRNVVLSGPVDATGNPQIAVISGSNIEINAAGGTLELLFSGGYTANGPLDYYFQETVGLVQDVSGFANGGYVCYAVYNPTNNTVTFEFETAAFGNQPYVISLPFDPLTIPSVASALTVAGFYWYDNNKGVMYRLQGSPLGWVQRFAIPLFAFGVSSGVPTGILNIPYLLDSKDTSSIIPTGSIITYPANPGQDSWPYGFVLCNGAAYDRVLYSKLFSIIGTTFGVGDGSTTFNVPDLRGEFIRGFDAGRGVDTGRVFGSLQLGTLAGMGKTFGTGDISGFFPASNTTDNNPSATIGVDAMTSFSGYNASIGFVTPGGDEAVSSSSTGMSRPRNVAMNYFIKF